MNKTMRACCWLISPENSCNDRSYQFLYHLLPSWLLNLIKVTFWYGLALTVGILLGNLR